MKFLTWILVLCFITQALAVTNVREGLQSAMNEFEYDMVVEWDQKDRAKAEQFTKKFTEKLEALYKEGLSDAEVMRYIETRVVDQKQLANIKASAALQAKGGSSAQNLAKALQENMDKFGNQGASWPGGAAYAAVISGILIVGALIVYQLVWNLEHRCAEGEMNEVCGEKSYCSDYDYDSEGNSYCDEWYTSWECDNVERCKRWEKYRDI
jgi:hypothetical protein